VAFGPAALPARGQQASAFDAGPGLSLVVENAKREQASFDNGSIQLKAGPGWLRGTKVLANFRLKLEFRTLAKDSDAGVVVRSWTGPDEWPKAGYRVRLSDAGGKAGSVLEGRRREVKAVGAVAAPRWGAPGEWQALEVLAEGERVTVAVNGQPAGAFEVDERAGYLFLDARKGAVELRGLGLEPLPRQAERPAGAMTVDALQQAGGTLPQVTRQVGPIYAYGTGLQGNVVLEAVVLPSGKAAGIRVTRSLVPDFDEAAIAALERWRFTPATLSGRPVPVIVSVEMAFTRQ